MSKGSLYQAVLLAAGLAVTFHALAADLCPAPPQYKLARPPGDVPTDHRIYIDSDDAWANVDLNAVFTGHVKIRQDDRLVEADSITYDRVNDKVTVKGKVNFLNPQLRVNGDAGTYDSALGTGSFDQANFQLMDRNGRGFAKNLYRRADGKIDLSTVRYTSCPVGNDDWTLQASSLTLDTDAKEGTAHNVVMRFKDVPIFYSPYLSFPLGDERKSGLLFPSLGHSSQNGWEAEVPYYFNLAPNYDLTVTPGILSARGVQLAENFRFLTHDSHGLIDATFLPNDKLEESDRSYVRVFDVTDLAPGLRFDTDIRSVSDSNYFLNFAVGSDGTSVTYLERRMDLYYYDDYWRIRGEMQNFQTVDVTVPDDLRPYSRLPRITANGLFPLADTNFTAVFNTEFVDFVRSINAYGPPTEDAAGTVIPSVNPTGARLNLAPELRYSYRGPGYFFEPAVGYDFTQYDLHDAGPGLPSTPTRSLPYARLDTGLLFERDSGSRGQRTQTLEPRIVYSYVPYRNQNELPVFDSGLPDLNLTQLFRTNRYVGYDRIGDANQLAMALTTRLFDRDSGTQWLSASIGQIRYFSTPRVDIPIPATLTETQVLSQQVPIVNPFEIPGALMTARGQLVPYPGQYPSANGYYYANGYQLLNPAAAANGRESNVDFPASDVVAEVALSGYKNLSLNLDYEINPYTQHTDKSEVAFQYRPDPSRVINIGYRFQEGISGPILKQYDVSFAWPIRDHWNTVGRWVYSMEDHQTIEQVAGVEYKSCCYKFQIVQRRYLTNRLGGLDTSYALQLELTGLSSVGKREDSFLEQSIRGYSTRDPSAQNAQNAQ